MILDLSPQTASTVLVRDRAAVSFRPEYAAQARVTATYSASLKMALDGEWVPSGAWRATFTPGKGRAVFVRYDRMDHHNIIIASADDVLAFIERVKAL